MTEFKRGDRIIFVKNDEYAGVEMPKGTLATYDDDGLSSAAPVVVLDTGECVRAWRSRIAPAGDHGTGDGSASDICAEPGCNCDLERRFPAPLDPSKVKAGDTVTVRVEPNPDTGWGTLDHGPEAIEVTGKVWLDSGDNPHGPVAKVGVHALGLPNVTLTAHQPAPAPEPEHAPGFYTVHPYDSPETNWTGFVDSEGTFYGEEDGFFRQAFKGDYTVDSRLVVIDPAEVDLVALTKIGDEAYLTDQSEFRHDGIQAAILAALAHLGIEVPR
jgi:hypothetical protein